MIKHRNWLIETYLHIRAKWLRQRCWGTNHIGGRLLQDGSCIGLKKKVFMIATLLRCKDNEVVAGVMEEWWAGEVVGLSVTLTCQRITFRTKWSCRVAVAIETFLFVWRLVVIFLKKFMTLMMKSDHTYMLFPQLDLGLIMCWLQSIMSIICLIFGYFIVGRIVI